MKVRDLIKRIEADGWRQVRTRGSHRQYKHRGKKGLVTISGHPSDDVHPDTLKSVLLQADLRKIP
jgi:predicted RNA binding protein YcfA (HicA-like mRNA interferase family)